MSPKSSRLLSSSQSRLRRRYVRKDPGDVVASDKGDSPESPVARANETRANVYNRRRIPFRAEQLVQSISVLFREESCRGTATRFRRRGFFIYTAIRSLRTAATRGSRPPRVTVEDRPGGQADEISTNSHVRYNRRVTLRHDQYTTQNRVSSRRFLLLLEKNNCVATIRINVGFFSLIIVLCRTRGHFADARKIEKTVLHFAKKR